MESHCRTISGARGLDLWENARLFALLNLASADGYIAAFHAKYNYNYCAQSQRFVLQKRTEILTPGATLSGHHFYPRQPSPITLPDTPFRGVPAQK